MSQANRVHSTPPTNTPIDTSRRGFLGGTAAALAAGTAVNVAALATIRPAAATIPIAAAASRLDVTKASQELRDAVSALDDAKDVLEAAKAAFIEADRKAWAWEKEHPEPTGKRARKRWARKFCDYRDDTSAAEWHAQLNAEKDFKKKQGDVAKFKPADLNDLGLMAAAAAMYDKTELAWGQTAIISYAVVLAYFRLCAMPTA